MLDISVKDLRNELKSKVLSNSLHLLLPKKASLVNVNFPTNDLFHYLPNEAFTLANYFYLFRLAELVAYDNYTLGRHNTIAAAAVNKPLVELSLTKSKTAGVLPAVGEIICQEVSSVNVFVACVAWLTTDEFRWHNINDLIQEDLSYNLVSDYYDYVLPFSCVITDYKRSEFVNKLSSDKLDLAYNLALKDVVKFKPNSKNFDKLKDLLQTT